MILDFLKAFAHDKIKVVCEATKQEMGPYLVNTFINLHQTWWNAVTPRPKRVWDIRDSYNKKKTCFWSILFISLV